MPISVKCSCGKTLKVDEKHRGKKAKCPACGNTVLVEEAEDEAKTAVQAETPTKRPAAKNDDDDPDEPESRKPIKRKAEKSNKMMYMIGGGCAFLLLGACCLTGVGVGVYYLFFSGPDADLAYVNADSTGFISIRVADVMKTTFAKDLMGMIPDEGKREKDDMEKKLGMTFADIERVTMVFGNLDKKNEKDLAVIVKTSKPMDSKKITAELADKADKSEVKYEGQTYYTFKPKGGFGSTNHLYFASDRIAIFTENEPTLKTMIKKSFKAPTHTAISRGVSLANSGRHQLVLAFKANDTVMKEAGNMAKKIESAKDLTGVILTASIDKQFTFEAIGIFAKDEQAKKAKTETDDSLKKGIEDTKKLADFMDGFKTAVKLLESIKTEQRGAELVITGKVDSDAKAFEGMMGGGGPKKGGGPKGKVGGGGIQGAAQRTQSINNLKQIALAMHSFHDVNKAFPNHAILSQKTGQPLLSWRVSLLPYLEQGALYNQIRRDEPFDSQHNRQFWDRIPPMYQLPGKAGGSNTYYQVFVGNESVFPRLQKPLINVEAGTVRMSGIIDGTSNTLLVVESFNPVNWMAPDDMGFLMNQPQGLPAVVGDHWGNDTFHAAFGDGSVRALRRSMAPMSYQALITRAGGEQPPNDADP